MAIKTTLCLVLLLTLLIIEPNQINSEPTQDKQALLSFLSQIPHSNRLQWDNATSACSFTGVQCDPTNTSVTYLRLPGLGLIGKIPENTLSRLSQLRVLSLRSNRLSGSIPPDFSQLTLLRSLYLQNNEFSGEFPITLTELTRLNRLDLSTNNFSGQIPFSIANLTRLTGLFLENNGFSGRIPSIAIPSLIELNVSNNNLNGSIPNSLARFPVSSFANNLALCGSPLPPCNPFYPSPAPAPAPEPEPEPNLPPPHKTNNSNKPLSTAAIIGISIAAAIPALILILTLILLLIRKNTTKTAKSHKPPFSAARSVTEGGNSSSKDDVVGGGSDKNHNKLMFFDGGSSGYGFDLEDLLRASAEVLGKGSLGTSYKAVLEEGTTVVVKRLKDVAAERREFEAAMVKINRSVMEGQNGNNNLMELRGFYYSRDEKLLLSDYMVAGSLSALLHGSRGSGRTSLDWNSRLRIATTAARGLAHLHAHANLVHGNIKSSNILLKQDSLEARVSDFGLNPLFSNATPTNHRIMGYRAPEVVETRKVTFKSDVYSFGVLILELLTGKAPNQASLGEEGIDLPRWVQSVVREEWTAEVFDVELMRSHNAEEEMVQLLQIGLACVAAVPDQRPTMQEVLRMIEDVNRRELSDDALKGGSDSQTPRASPPGVTP